MKFFTIGSCFAREIRKVLEADGYDVTPKDELDRLIYYNTYSILYEFERPPREFYQNSDGSWQCPYRRLLQAENKQALEGKSRKLDEYIDECIERSDFFIFTLGMSEVHKHGDLVYSNHPQYMLGPGVRTGAKSEFYNSTRADNLWNLIRLRNIIRSKKPEARIVLTVSPVPLLRTFTKLGTGVANKISKETLLWSAKQVLFTEYFDSYEYATERDCFQPDGRHVKPQIIKEIVQRFYENIIR